jgi:hypothetical protein|nr:hypothetical protein Q903MT_gene2182 [Picea sitchensis]
MEEKNHANGNRPKGYAEVRTKAGILWLSPFVYFRNQAKKRKSALNKEKAGKESLLTWQVDVTLCWQGKILVAVCVCSPDAP